MRSLLLALASISAFKQLTLRYSLIIKRGEQASQNRTFGNREARGALHRDQAQSEQLQRRRGDALLRLTESFQSTAARHLNRLSAWSRT